MFHSISKNIVLNITQSGVYFRSFLNNRLFIYQTGTNFKAIDFFLIFKGLESRGDLTTQQKPENYEYSARRASRYPDSSSLLLQSTRGFLISKYLNCLARYQKRMRKRTAKNRIVREKLFSNTRIFERKQNEVRFILLHKLPIPVNPD